MFGMNFQMSDDDYFLNYKEIANAEWVLPTIRLLAIDLQKCPYISLGDWFKSLSNRSIDELQEMAENVDEDPDNEQYVEQAMLLSMMLSGAEGTADVKNMETTRHQLSMLLSLITFESLARKGLVRVYRENYTLGDDMGEKIVVEKM